MQAQIDRENADFWNALCGSNFARAWGVVDDSPASLRKFDDGYFNYYPYLLSILLPERWAGRKVLEIGLGYGSVAQELAEAGADYHGLDIAENPGRMVNARLARLGKREQSRVGSALAIPHADESFDAVISIGCLHHTGDLPKALREVSRVLRPNGTAIVMVYNAFSFREWLKRPRATLRRWWSEKQAIKARIPEARQRAEYDADAAGHAAPETTLTSTCELRGMLIEHLDVVRLQKRNCDSLSFRRRTLVRRERLLPTLGRWLGLDLYVEAVKRRKAAVRMAA